jgi:hypothetical protein
VILEGFSVSVFERNCVGRFITTVFIVSIYDGIGGMAGEIAGQGVSKDAERRKIPGLVPERMRMGGLLILVQFWSRKEDPKASRYTKESLYRWLYIPSSSYLYRDK